MNNKEFNNLLSQREALKRMIERSNPEHVLEHRSLKAALSEIEEIISSRRLVSDPARVRLTFNGKPVIGSHGIYADFASKIVNAFTDTITAVAASLSEPLAAKGPIPNKDLNQLLITNTVLGSFGFELEEYRPESLLIEDESAVAIAIEKTQKILEGTTGTDDELADSIVETDPRAIGKLKNFLSILSENESVCALQYKERFFRFSDVTQVKSSLQRISSDNLSEEERDLPGIFIGFIPKTRTFEFRPNDQEESIVGKALPSLTEIGSINSHLNQPATVKMLVTTVGNGKPRYQLIGSPVWNGA